MEAQHVRLKITGVPGLIETQWPILVVTPSSSGRLMSSEKHSLFYVQMGWSSSFILLHGP